MSKKDENRTELTPERLDALRAERSRTMVGSESFMAQFDDAPDGLSHAVINGWLYGRTKTVAESHFQYVLEKYQSLPTAPDSVRRSMRSGHIAITDEMRSMLNAELDRTGISLTTLGRAKPQGAKKLSPLRISHWRTGQSDSANQIQWDCIIGILKTLPDRNA